MALSFLDGYSNRHPFGAKLRGLLLHLLLPSRVQFSDMHIDAHLRQSAHSRGRRIGKIAREARDGPEILWIGHGYMKRADASIGLAGDVKLPVGDSVVS